MQIYNETSQNDQGQELRNFCIANNLRIANTFFKHNIQNKITWKNSRGHHSTIDYIITSTNIKYNEIMDIHAIDMGYVGTDHNLLIGKFKKKQSQFKKKPTTEGKCNNLQTSSRYNVELLEQDSIKILYQNRLKQHITCNM